MDDPAVATTAFLDAFHRTVCALFSVSGAALFPTDAATAAADGGSPADAREAAIAAWLCEAGRAGDSFVVTDIAAEPGLHQALARTAATVGFVAGVPVAGAAGAAFGALCIFDERPRAFAAEDLRKLQDVATVAGAHLAAEARAATAVRQGELFRLLAESSTDTIVRGNLDGVRLYISPSVRALLGYEPAEMIGRRAMEIVHPDDLEAFGHVMADVRAGHIDVAVTEQRQRHKEGHWVWLEAFVKLTRDPKTGEADGYVASVRDVSRRKLAEVRLEHIASHDALTGLANRTLFHARLAEEIARARRSGGEIALICLDLDCFKEVNDRFGHEAGDCVLRAAADRFRAAIQPGDTIARLGGDEFALIHPAPEAADARTAAGALAERLIAAMSEPIDFAGEALGVGMSAGIALASTAGFDADGLLRSADLALYRAKQAGRGRHVFEAGTGRP